MIRADFALELGEILKIGGNHGSRRAAQYAIVRDGQRSGIPADCRFAPQWARLSEPGYPEHGNATAETGGTAGGLQGGVRASTGISIAGQRVDFYDYTLDGAENTDPNFNSYVVHPSVDAVQEFKVQTGIYSAEFGRGASQINVNTLPGSNQYHGALFEFLRNSYMDAASWSVVGANPFRRNNFGFTLGGPVTIPKVFNGQSRRLSCLISRRFAMSQ